MADVSKHSEYNNISLYVTFIKGIFAQSVIYY